MNLTTTNPPTTADVPVYVGFITIAIAVLFYGTFLIPVKKFNTGDGMFFQLVLCMGIWFVGFVVNWIRDFPKFYALPMLGGAMFTTGNVCSVPVIKFIGLALGILIWGTTSLVLGWANARFGWFGIIEQVPNILWMNYVGVALAAFSGFFYVFVKPNMEKNEIVKISDEENTSVLDKLNPNLRRIIGVALSIFAGVLYGLSYAPYTHLVDNYKGASKNGLDYVFSTYSGTLVTSIIYYIIYAIGTKNNPYINIKAILPSFVSGLLWGIANCCFLIANTALSQSITFPIGASGAPLVASLCSIFVFREIKERRNLIILAVGYLFTLIGAIFTGLSI